MRSETRLSAKPIKKQKPQPPIAFETLVWADDHALRRFAEWLGVTLLKLPTGATNDAKRKVAKIVARALKRGATRELTRARAAR